MNKQKILIPLDGSEFSRQVFATIRRFFAPESTELILFEAVDPMPRSIADEDIIKASEMVTGALLRDGERIREHKAEAEKRQYYRTDANLRQHEDALAASAKGLTEAGYTVKPWAEVGDAAEKIISTVRTSGADIVVMATHGRSGLSKVLMGSVAEQVLHQSPVPVLCVRPSSNK